MSLSSQFPGVAIEEWVRHTTDVPAPEHRPPPRAWSQEEMHKRLMPLGFDPFESDPLRLPRQPPTPEQLRAHLDAVEAGSAYLEERGFDQDSESMVEAQNAHEACANGPNCVTSANWRDISGMTRAMVLRRLPPPHSPLCLLCHRAAFADALIKDRYDRRLIDAPSSLARPGEEAYVKKQLRPVQSFYNLCDQPGEYSSKFVMVGEEDDLVVMPLAKLSLKFLFVRDGRVTQEALRYVQDPGAVAVPGETVERLKQRVRPPTPPPTTEWLIDD